MDNKHFDDRYLAFGAGILNLVSRMPTTAVCRHIADQLFRSGTSIGANLQEGRAAESRADFIHKFQVALKEMRETGYWLALLEKSGLVDRAVLQTLLAEAQELTAILAKSVITAKRNQPVIPAGTSERHNGPQN
jgi:four helix bundle protein